MAPLRTLRALLSVALAAVLGVAVLSCATLPGGVAGWRWFEAPGSDDVWSEAIVEWQERSEGQRPDAPLVASAATPAARAARAATQSAELPPTLALAYLDFQREQRLDYARQVADWIQEQSQEHFRADGEVDHWGTLEEVLDANGDDCDGLALLAYHLLRDGGFGAGELYQAIVYRAEDEQYHMVTLWFEEPDDPWVIDPTAAMTDEMKRMSAIPDWRPLKLFSEDEEYTVRHSSALPAVAAPPPSDD